jgi:hypothetical protein
MAPAMSLSEFTVLLGLLGLFVLGTRTCTSIVVHKEVFTW